MAFAATFLAPLVLVRLFTQAQFGTYKQLFLIYATLYNIGQVGMAESLFYFLPRSGRDGGGYVANSVLSLAAAGMAGLALLGAGGALVARWLGNPGLNAHLGLLGLFFMLMMPAAAVEIVMISRQRYLWGACSYGVSDVLRSLALVAPAVLWHSLDAILLGACVFAAARLLAALAYFRREFGGTFWPQAILGRRQLAYALPFAVAVVIETAQLNYHQYAVAHYFDAATFAIYSVGCFQLPLFELVASPMANVMMVRMAEKQREGREEESLVVWNRTTRVLALMFFPVVALLMVAAGDVIVFLFTESYRASAPIFAIWSLGLAASVLQTDAVLRVYAATRFMLLVGVLKLAFIAALIGAFMSVFGLRGAVLVTFLAMAAMKGVALAKIQRLMGVRFPRLLPWRDLGGIGLAAAAAALPALMVRAAVEGPVSLRLALTGLVHVGVYLLILFNSPLLADEERLAVRGWVQRFMPGALPAQEPGR